MAFYETFNKLKILRLQALHTRAQLLWKWTRCSSVRKAKGNKRASPRERKVVGLVFHTVVESLERATIRARARKGRKVKTRVKENLRKARAMAAAMATMETTAACAEYVASPAIGAMSVPTGTALAKSMLVPKMLRLVKLVMVRAQQLHPCRGGRARLQQFHHRRHLQRW